MANEAFPSIYTGAYVAQRNNETKNYEVRLSQDDKGVFNIDQNDFGLITSTRRRRLIQDLLGDSLFGDVFKCTGTGASNDFTIAGGGTVSDPPLDLELTALERGYLGGYQLVAPVATTTYTGQDTDFNDGNGDTPTALSPPITDPRIDTIQLHVYKKEITGVEDADLIPDTFGLVASVTNRERVIMQVEVVVGVESATPVAPAITANVKDGNGVVNYFMKLGEISRAVGVAAIAAVDITDIREIALLVETPNLPLTLPQGAPTDDDPPAPGFEAGSGNMFLDYLDFDADNDNVFRGEFPVPDDADLSKGMAFRMRYRMLVAAASDVVLDFDLDTYEDGDPVSTPGNSVAVTNTLTTPNDTDIHKEEIVGLIPSSVLTASGSHVAFRFARDADAGGDTHTARLRLYGLRLLYSKVG